MRSPNFFLRTKLLPPRAVPELLKRPRLTDKLRENLNASVTLVAADAGWGKTTLIADFLSEETRRSVWYQLDHTDADPIVFLSYLTEGLKSLHPDFGQAIIAYLAESNEELFRFPERAADLFVNELLGTIEQPFVVVLDDYHHIGNDTVVHKIVDRILQYSSELLHLIITTRDLPPLAIMRRRAQSDAKIITRDDLLFNDQEISELFQNSLNIKLGPQEIAEYRDRTHGWITALQLVSQVAKREFGTDGSLRNQNLAELLNRSERDIFDYFAEEVLEREAPDLQRDLLYLSLPGSLPLEQASLLFPDMRCSALLPALAQKNVFLTVSGERGSGEEYRFHPLFRDFLQRRLRSEIGQADVAAERIRIAQILLNNDRSDLALPYLIEAEDYARAAEVIADDGSDWIAGGLISSLSEIGRRVPNEFLELHPRSLLHIAEVARLQGDTDRATKLLRRAVSLFETNDLAADEGEALHSLASLARRKGDTTAAFQLLDRAEKCVEETSETFVKCLNTRGLCLIAEGKWNEAEQQFRAALDLAEAQSNQHFIRLAAHNLALAPGFRGDFGEALRWFNRMFRADEPGRQLPQEAIGHLNVARLHLYRGEFEQTEHHLGRALELSQLFNLRSLIPEVFEAYANFYRETLDLGHAAEFYERSLSAYEDAGIDITTREVNEERAKFFLLRGDPMKARAMLETLIEARSAKQNDLETATAKTLLCRVDLVEKKTDGLAQRIGDLIDLFRRNSHYYDEALAQMLLAETFFSLGNVKETVEPVMRLLDLSSRFDYEYWVKKEIRRNPSIFSYEDIEEKLPPDLREAITEPASVVEAAKVVEPLLPVTDLTIRVLGPVEIFRDSASPFAPDAWTTRRSRDIFCYIATSRNRRVSKDLLIETFWPDQDPATIEKNFHPTISHIRKALNSRQTFKQNFLVFRDGSYQLDPDLNYSIDYEEFERHISDAETAKSAKDNDALSTSLEKAHELYRGEFMSGVYENWADERRQFYIEQFARVQSALAKLAFGGKRWANALKFAREVLKSDPYREDIHRLAMKTLAAQHKPAAVKKHFDEMCALFNDELGIKPSPETRRLYDELIG